MSFGGPLTAYPDANSEWVQIAEFPDSVWSSGCNGSEEFSWKFLEFETKMKLVVRLTFGEMLWVAEMC